MGIAEELKKQGYELEYEYGDAEDHTEVWINQEKRTALRMEWMRIENHG
ncbi:hypothetical protein ACFL09_03460 [Planctomycetota bacterium]